MKIVTSRKNSCYLLRDDTDIQKFTEKFSKVAIHAKFTELFLKDCKVQKRF